MKIYPIFVTTAESAIEAENHQYIGKIPRALNFFIYISSYENLLIFPYQSKKYNWTGNAPLCRENP